MIGIVASDKIKLMAYTDYVVIAQVRQRHTKSWANGFIIKKGLGRLTYHHIFPNSINQEIVPIPWPAYPSFDTSMEYP